MNQITKEQLLAQRLKVPTEWIDIPGGQVLVAGLTAAEYGQYQDEITSGSGNRRSVKFEHSRAILLTMGLRNPDGTRMFGAADIAKCDELPAAIAEPIAEAILRLSGVTSGAQEQIEKNSLTNPSCDSGTDSPAISG